MTYNNSRNAPAAVRTKRNSRGLVLKLALVSTAAVLFAGCKAAEDGPQVAGWSVVDPTQRHPILVSQQPSNLSLKVPRGSTGMSPHQRAQVVDFLNRFRGGDSGNSRARGWCDRHIHRTFSGGAGAGRRGKIGTTRDGGQRRSD